MSDKSNYKAIILAGGKGTRLFPITKVISKQLLPVYDMPMIFYPLHTLIHAGLKEVLLITNPENINIYKSLLGEGEDFNISISYAIQEEAKGIAQAFDIAKDWLAGSNCVLILGDNLFLAGNTSNKLKNAMKKNNGAYIFGYKVKDPTSYGVVHFDKNHKVLNIEEKPKEPKSDWIVTGLYVYDNMVTEYFNDLKPSQRGELEITDLNNIYLERSKIDIKLLSEDSLWLDAGTKDSLLEASNIVKNLKVKNIELF